MSAPSGAHEHRVTLLGQAADLAGLHLGFHLGDGLVPDVGRVDPYRRKVLIGDAKHNETPGCAETARRLRRYAVPVLGLVRSGVAVRLALAVPSGRGAHGWAATLHDAVAPRPSDGRGRLKLDATTTLVWVDLVPYGRSLAPGNRRSTAGSASRLDEALLVD